MTAACGGLGGGTPPAPAPQEGEREGVRGEKKQAEWALRACLAGDSG